MTKIQHHSTECNIQNTTENLVTLGILNFTYTNTDSTYEQHTQS